MILVVIFNFIRLPFELTLFLISLNDTKMSPNTKSVCIVVLGDIARSPRMQYHAISLAEHGHKVDVVGYGETKPPDALTALPLLSCHYLSPHLNFPYSRFVNYILKATWQALSLLAVLLIIRRPDVVIVQNPPAVPTLLVCWFFTLLVRAKLIIDWHNYAHTIMALSTGSKNFLIRITEKMECFVGRRAASNFCVTNAMKKDLEHRWGVRAVTLYDRPPQIFCPISLEEKHELLLRLGQKYKLLLSDSNTVFTSVDASGKVSVKTDRPGLLVSSTSWTEDEDFSILFAALQEYENHIQNGNSRKLPDLICIITGKGPLKDYYSNKIEESAWEHVSIITPWLESEDYPRLLASADLGVCLHTSSSGLDLPMKVVDMFGCGLPVCAYDFDCLHELVQNRKNSYTFKDSGELSRQLQQWFEGFPNNKQQNAIQKQFETELKAFQEVRWKDNWNQIALPIIME